MIAAPSVLNLIILASKKKQKQKQNKTKQKKNYQVRKSLTPIKVSEVQSPQLYPLLRLLAINKRTHKKTKLISLYTLTDPVQFSFPTKVIFTSAMLFTFLVSVMGNSLVIYVITKNHSMRTSTNCLVMNLAICDLLITVIHTPASISYLYIRDSWFDGTVGNITCKMSNYGRVMSLLCSIFNLVAIAIDRFLAVTQPLRHKLSSKWLVKIAIPIIWLSSALLSIGAALSSKVEYIGEDHGTPKCYYEGKPHDEYAALFCLVGSFIALIVLYSVVCYRLWRRNIPGEVSSNQHALAVRTARKVTILMITVVIVFVLSWALWFVAVLSNAIDSNSFYTSIFVQYPFLFAISYWLVLNSSACNPCLYFIFIESFRQGFKTACVRCWAPRLRMCRFGQERKFETQKALRSRETLEIVTPEEGAVELISYSPSRN